MVRLGFSLRVLVGVRMRNLVEIWFKIRLKHTWCSGWEKALFWLNLVFAVLIIWFIWLKFGWNLVENCWDRFDTEVDAIRNCEK